MNALVTLIQDLFEFLKSDLGERRYGIEYPILNYVAVLSGPLLQCCLLEVANQRWCITATYWAGVWSVSTVQLHCQLGFLFFLYLCMITT